MSAWPRMITCAVWARLSPRIGLSRSLSRPWSHSTRLFAYCSVLWNAAGMSPSIGASHLNRIECHFWAYVEFVINGSDYPDWTAFSKATQAYIRRRNRDRHDPRIIELENRRKVA